MRYKIMKIDTKNNLILVATFFDGTVKEFDVSTMFSMFPQMRDLQNKDLFRKVKVDVGGYGVMWNDDLDLDADTIWEEGLFIEKVVVDIKLEFANIITEARINAGITQKELAEITGIYQSDISKIERGLANPSLSTMQRMAEGLGKTLEIKFN